MGYVAAGATAAATAVGLFRLSDGTDLAMLLGPLAVGVMLTLIYDRIEHDAAEQRRLHAEVSLAQGQLAASERRAGTIAERERVSREIHDTVTQGLASSLLLLEAADRSWPGPASRQELTQATELLRRNLSETRSLVHELAAPGLDASPLPEALHQAAAQYVPHARLLVTGEPRAVPAEVRHTLLRVVQSAAANIQQHANAATTTLTLGFLPDSVTLDIYDDGTGFDPSAAAPPSDAGGYGLRAMRQRVEQLGGVFSVESSPGEGTIVAAQVPARAQRAPAADKPGRRMTAITVLLVDDHLVVRSGLKALLGTQPDFDVVAEAASGEEALELVEQHSPAVVVMDLAMGAGMDGIEAIRQLRQRNSRQAILVFTTYDSDADIVRAVDAGAMGYLLKDAAPDEIFAAIRGAVQGKSVMSAPVASRLFQQLRNPGRGPDAPGSGAAEPPDRGAQQPGAGPAALHLRGHGQDPSGAHLRQARRGDPRRGHRHGHPPGGHALAPGARLGIPVRPCPTGAVMRATIIHGPGDIRVEDRDYPVGPAAHRRSGQGDGVVRLRLGPVALPRRQAHPPALRHRPRVHRRCGEHRRRRHGADGGRLRHRPVCGQLRRMPAVPQRRHRRVRPAGRLGRPGRRRGARSTAARARQCAFRLPSPPWSRFRSPGSPTTRSGRTCSPCPTSWPPATTPPSPPRCPPAGPLWWLATAPWGSAASWQPSGSGAERIIAMSRHADRQAIAREFGATDIVEERGRRRRGEGPRAARRVLADSVLECVGTKESMEQALHSVRPGGALGFVGVPTGGAEIPLRYLFDNNITVAGGMAPARTYIPELLADVLAGTHQPRPGVRRRNAA